MARVEDTRTWISDVVRSGLWADDELSRQVSEAVAADHPTLPAGTAEAWIADARAAWHEQASGWPAVTDHDRLTEAFAALEGAGVAVLQGCADHWEARDLLNSADDLRGIVWFTAPDVWHAIDEGMLEVNLWHADTANAAPGDPLLDEVIAAFAAAGLEAHFDEGRIEVAAYWQRRP
ncbi:MAG: hypothetical protein J7518_07095 [Nocardioidaceae bacterium]|nr:hypothetical protein [Nocardioidaceae bacterium]